MAIIKANPMKLLTQEILKKLPKLRSTEKQKDPIVQVKFFTPWTYWTWFATEYDPKDRLFFGLVHGHEKEMGYFSLDELESVRGPAGLRIERDLYWKPVPLSQVQSGASTNPRQPRTLKGWARKLYRMRGDKFAIRVIGWDGIKSTRLITHINKIPTSANVVAVTMIRQDGTPSQVIGIARVRLAREFYIE